MVKPFVEGIDLGNNKIKTSGKKIFSNKVKLDLGILNDNSVFTFQGTNYALEAGAYETGFNKVEKKSLLVTLFAALAMESNDVAVSYKVVVGLPVQHYKLHKDALKNLIMQNRTQDVTYLGIKRRIVIEDVLVRPEGLSVWSSLSPEILQEIGNNDVIIVDIGGRTTDVCSLEYANGQRKIGGYKTIEFGMLNVYNDIVEPLNALYAKGLTLDDGEQILVRGGINFLGKPADLSYIKPMLAGYVDSLIHQMNLNFPKLDSSTILLMGGGGQYLTKGFQRRHPNSILVNEPIFGNAIGFKKVGEQIF